MTAKKHFVQSNDATARHTSGSNLTPKSLNLRQVRRAAAAFNYEVGRRARMIACMMFSLWLLPAWVYENRLANFYQGLFPQIKFRGIAGVHKIIAGGEVTRLISNSGL
jgi:hypothetical protein